MNTTIRDLTERRSIRRYKAEQISKAELEEVLKAGVCAPTGMNRQSPIIVAVQKAETVKLLSKLNAEVMGSNNDPFYGAPTVLVVLADPEVRTYVHDGALVMGNLMNAAHAVGLGSCYIFRAKEVFETDEGKALLKKWGVPENYVGIGNCILGYPAEGGTRPVTPRKENYIIWA